jgi:putative protease
METKVGRVLHFYTKIGVAVVELTDGNLNIGDDIIITGMSTNFGQKVESMQIEGKNIENATKGQKIGLKVANRIREGDIIWKRTNG